MYGDTSAMRRRAAQMREQGSDVRALADHLVAETEGLDWTGRAAEAMHARIRDRATQLRDSATAHELAADSLEAHLHEVDRLKAAIAAVERTAPRGAFTPPPPGHRDWLEITPEGR